MPSKTELLMILAAVVIAGVTVHKVAFIQKAVRP